MSHTTLTINGKRITIKGNESGYTAWVNGREIGTFGTFGAAQSAAISAAR